MAKKKDKSNNLSGYFKKLFNDNQEWLQVKSNQEVLARYRADNNLSDDATIPQNVKEAMSNAKSNTRKALGIGISKRRKARKLKAVASATAPPARSASKLQTLEEHIDDCMSFAKNYDREGLAQVITLLRRARNAIIFRLGEPDSKA